MEKSLGTQVEADAYFNKSYLSMNRWIAYYEQIMHVADLPAVSSILEVGIGNGVFYNFMKTSGLQIYSADVDPQLKPDYLCSVLELSTLKKTFDLVCAFEVLEHLPFEHFEQALRNLFQCSNRWVVLSLPFPGYRISGILDMGRYGEHIMSFVLKTPLFWKKHKFDGQHYWEIGKRSYRLKKIKQVLEKHCQIKKIKKLQLSGSQIFFVLEKKP